MTGLPDTWLSIMNLQTPNESLGRLAPGPYSADSLVNQGQPETFLPDRNVTLCSQFLRCLVLLQC